MCSTVHGSYQLSTDHPPTPPMTASRPAQPQPHTCMQTRRHHQTIPSPLGTWSWLVPISPIKPKGNILFKSPHPQILHAILGQMNKQKLLLLTFMQNNREGTLGVCLAAITARKGGHQEHRRSLSPAWPRPPQDTGHPSSGPVSHLLRRLALIPSSLGVGWNVVTGVRVLEGANPHSSLGRAGCLSLSGVKAGGPRPGSKKWPHATLCPHACQCHLVRRHTISVQETRQPRMETPLPILGLRISPSCALGDGPLAPRAGRKRRRTQGQTGGRLS